jgi:KaiC/GvpD/RAD55 family RecA-like ATPase/predicted hydrocarbon binding protein
MIARCLGDMSTYLGSGCGELDRLLGGGIVPEAPYLFEYEPGVGYIVFVANYLNEGLRAGDLVAIVTSDYSHSKLISELNNLGVNVQEALDKEQLVILDVSGMEWPAKPTLKNVLLSSDPRSVHKVTSEIMDFIHDTGERLAGGRFSHTRCALLSLTSLLQNREESSPYKIARNIVSTAMRPSFTFLTAVERDVLGRNELVAVENLFQGILELRAVREKDGRYEKRLRVISSPISGFFPHEVPYQIIRNVIVVSTPVYDIASLLTSNFPAEHDKTLQPADSPRVLLNTHELSHFIEHLTNTIGYESMSRILYQYAKETIKPTIEKILSVTRVNVRNVDAATYQDLVKTSIALMSTTGFGTPESIDFDPSSDEFRIKVTNSPICLYFKDQGRPINFVLAGALGGIAEVIRNEPFECVEEKCIAKGDDYCEYVVRTSSKQTTAKRTS